MNFSPSSDSITVDGRFPITRRGYQREVVDHFVASAESQIAELRHYCEAVAAENQRLHEALEAKAAPVAPGDYSALGGRAQEILRIAEEQAHDMTDRAARDADAMVEQAQAERDWLRSRADSELAQIRETGLAQLETLRQQGEYDATHVLASAQEESDRLLTSAKLQAAAVRAEAENAATELLRSAALEAQALTVRAEREAASVRDDAAAQRETVIADLRLAQENSAQISQQLMNEAAELQREATDHLQAETEHAAELRRDTLAEAERVKVEAIAEAERIVSRAQQQAATIDERARQEFAWRRRQMRHEQDLLNRRREAMMGQLTSLSALAVDTVENLPKVPELILDDLGFDTDLPELGRGASGGAPALEAGAEASFGPETAETEEFDALGDANADLAADSELDDDSELEDDSEIEDDADFDQETASNAVGAADRTESDDDAITDDADSPTLVDSDFARSTRN